MADEIDSQTLIARMGSGNAPKLIDVREIDEFSQGHITNSINIPLSELSDWLAGSTPTADIVFVCKSGQRSVQAASFARMIGFSNVQSLTGGIAGM